jgi:DNA-directed RNA polymerase specialized sigma24 family protein
MLLYGTGIRVFTMADESLQEQFRISPIDCHGRVIAPEVMSAANQIGGNALRYAEKVLGDPALALSLFEESAATVSRVLIRQTNDDCKIRNLQAYLFRAFIRRVNRLRRREFLLIGRLSTELRESRRSSSAEKLELELLVSEILTRSDAVMRDMFYRRSEGYSWKEIGRAYGISAHAAESRFSQALRKLRKKISAPDAL